MQLNQLMHCYNANQLALYAAETAYGIRLSRLELEN